MQTRGTVTERITQKSKELLGVEISNKELRLMAYIVTRMMNERSIGRQHIDQEEREILDKWQRVGYLDRNAFISLTVTQEFWDAMTQLIWLGYVDLSDE